MSILGAPFVVCSGKDALFSEETRVELLQLLFQLEWDVLTYLEGAYIELADSDSIDCYHIHGFRVIV